MSLLNTMDRKKQLAMGGSQAMADAHNQRTATNDALKDQHKSSQIAGVGSAAGLGVATAMATTGPIGLAVGGLFGLISLL